MKRVVRFLIISLAPVAILIAYSNLYFVSRVYTSTHYDMLPLFIAVAAGFALIGTAIFFICKNTLKDAAPSRIPIEFLIGIVLVIFPILSLFIGISLPTFFFVEMGTGMSLTGLFVGVYICLFITVLRRRAKALKEE